MAVTRLGFSKVFLLFLNYLCFVLNGSLFYSESEKTGFDIQKTTFQGDIQNQEMTIHRYRTASILPLTEKQYSVQYFFVSKSSFFFLVPNYV